VILLFEKPYRKLFIKFTVTSDVPI